jgi:iron complex transport system substrate-binding protein
MLWLGQAIYPELYQEVDLKQTVIEAYYKDIIGLDIDDETYEMIISGEGLRKQGSGSGVL